jgi:signal transduction histidine kinase/DNA-binding response OmpR family regulator
MSHSVRLHVASLFALFLGLGGAVASVAAQITPARAAPGYQHRHWTASDGLPVNQVSGWHQSEDGYIWLSTFDGFIRFDGARFTTVARAEPPALPGARYAGILGEAGGRLWLAGVPSHLVEVQGGVLRDHPGVSGNAPPRAILEGAHPEGDPSAPRTLWAGTASGLHKWRDGRFQPALTGLIDEPVNALHLDSRGVLWVGTESRLLSISEGGEGVLRVHPWPAGDPVYRVLSDPEGALWAIGLRNIGVVQGEGIRLLPPFPVDLFAVQVIRPLGSPNSVLLQSRRGSYVLRDNRWVLIRPDSSGRLPPEYGFHGPDGSLWVLGTDFVAVNGSVVLEGEGFQGIEFDRDGATWVWGMQGLHRLQRGLIRQRGAEHGFPPNTYAVNEGAGGAVWTTFLEGGRGNLARVDGEQVDRWSGPGVPSFEMAVLEDRAGQVWVALAEGGVCLLEGRRCEVAAELGGRVVKGIFESSVGDLWFGTESGVYRRTPEGAWRYWGVGEGLAHGFVRSFEEDTEGRIWMGTFGGGVSIWDGVRFETLGPAEGLSGGAVRSIRVDSRGTVWVGTEADGLNRVVRSAGPAGASRWRVHVFTMDHGLADNGIHEILEDDDGRLWMSSNRGIFWVPLEDFDALTEGRLRKVRATAYNERHGLLERELNGSVHASGIRTRDGRLLFAGIAGTAEVEPWRVSGVGGAPGLYIEAVRAGDEVLVGGLGRAALRKGVRSFEVDYTALDFADPENVRFRYRLEGLDADWVDAGNRRTAYYTNVPPGGYALRVAVWRGGGEWVEVDEPLQISVAPYLHERRSIQGAALLLLFLTLGVGVSRRERWSAARRAELESLVAARTRVAEEQAERLKVLDTQKNLYFQDLSHELRTPLTLILGSAEALRSRVLDPVGCAQVDEVVGNTRRIRALVDQILDLARLESGAVALRPVSVDPEVFIDSVVQAFAPAAERFGIRVVSRAVPGLPFVLLDPQQLWTVLSNLVLNAIKFSDQGTEVEVSVGLDDLPEAPEASPRLRITVRDQGIGIPEAELSSIFERFQRGRRARADEIPGAGIGLALSKRIVELHGGSLQVESTVGVGSSFHIRLPLELAALAGEPIAPTVQEPLEVPELWGAGIVLDGVVGRPVSLDLERSSLSGATEASPARVSEARDVVLVADDVPQVRRLVGGLLKDRFDVQEAGTAEDALARIRARVPDVLVCDVRMPGGGAERVLGEVRGDPALQHLPVLLLSASASPEDRVLGFSWGADDYLTKPFEPSELVARVEALRNAGARRAAGIRPAIHLHPGAVDVETDDARFLGRLRDVIEENLANPEFGVEDLAKQSGYSRSALYRRLATLGANSAADLIRQMRLARGRQLLEARAGSVNRVARMCGFSSPAHFSRLFRDEYGYPPSQFPSASKPPA